MDHGERTNIVDLLNSKQTTKICAPMVRYSKLSFRTLVRKYGCDVAYTPMILSTPFVKSQDCRKIEFITNSSDRPLIVQFAANNSKDFVDACELVYPYSDGVCLNCGCPQKWAMAEGYGAKLMQRPEDIVDYIKTVRGRITDSRFSISAKIRIHKDIRKTVDMCRKLENAGVSFITIHGRTTLERCQPVHYDAIKLVKESVSVPIVANGDVTNLTGLEKVQSLTSADGVMVARGLLSNPAMFHNYLNTPIQCVNDWVDISLKHGTAFTCFHNHLIYMMDKVTSKSDKYIFNALKSTPAVLEYLDKYMRKL